MCCGLVLTVKLLINTEHVLFLPFAFRGRGTVCMLMLLGCVVFNDELMNTRADLLVTSLKLRELLTNV